MLKLYILLFLEFFKTGLFALGGGLATIPFLYEMMETYGWFTKDQLLNMIAISESTPGAMGVNMATYVGYEATGGSILGGITTTVGLVAPSIIIVCLVAKILQKFKNSHWVQDAFYGLRPAVAAMIASAGLGVFINVIFPSEVIAVSSLSWIHLGLFCVFLGISLYFKKLHPILLICLCAVIGIVLSL